MPYAKQCHECGGAYQSRQYSSEFCGTPCRRKFNNRRATRGAALYDLVMIERHDRDAFTRSRLEGRLEKLISKWDAQDAKRRTWKRPLEVMFDTASL